MAIPTLTNTPPRSFCKLCRRPLRNFTSVKIGIGPTCRAIDKLQGEFSFMGSRIELLDHIPGKYIFIQDMKDMGDGTNRSVHDDVENVIRYLYLNYSTMSGTRIFCRDKDGIYEILHSNNMFKGLKPGHDGIDLAGGGKCN